MVHWKGRIEGKISSPADASDEILGEESLKPAQPGKISSPAFAGDEILGKNQLSHAISPQNFIAGIRRRWNFG